jgi:P4 family phage/plasmid primase-like protien
VSDNPSEQIASTQFIQELWKSVPGDWIVEINLLQYRPTQENPGDQRMRALFYPASQVLSDWPNIQIHLDHLNRTEVENVHHGVNPRFRKPRKHGTNADVSHYVAAWVDVDFKGNEESVRKQFNEIIADLRARRLAPSVIVESGRGLHAYWLFDKPYPSAQARPVCAGIQDYFKISDAVHDPRRILRLPGFLNLKNPKDPKLCFVSEATWERFAIDRFAEFAIKDFKKSSEDVLAETEEKERAKISTSSRDPKIEEIKDGVDESGGPYGGRHLAAVALSGHYCAKLKTRKLALYAISDWNKKNRPPLPEDEIEKIVEDIWAKEEIKRSLEKEDRRERKRDAPRGGPEDGPPWFDENGKLIPAMLAAHMMIEHKFVATPIGADGRGVTLYVYENGVYRSGGFDFARREIVKALGKTLRDKNLTEIVELVTELSKKPYDEIDRRSKDLINVKNGMLDWRTGELLAHDPKYLSTIQIPAAWDPAAKSEKLDAFLATVLPADTISLVEEYAGYMMIPDTSMTKCLVLVGEGGNGKSTFLGLVDYLIGDRNISHYSLHNLTEERFAAAGIIGKLVNSYDELEAKALENTGLFKQIVGGNPIKAEEKGKAPFSFRPFCRMVFSTNQMPRATDRSQAYFDRFLFIQFNRRIRDTGGEVKRYEDVLVAEPGLLSALLVKSILGLRRLSERGRFLLPASSKESLEEYQRDCNSAYDFLRDCCRMDDPNGWLAGPLVYERYKLWSEESGRKPMSTREFNRTIRSANVREVRRGSARGWGGVSWINGQPPQNGEDEVRQFGEQEPPEVPSGPSQTKLDF